MKITGKKLMALALVFCLVSLSGNLSAQAQAKKGVKLEVETNDGQIISGELISVKRDSLLLLDAETQADMSVNIDVIKTILVNNKSRMIEIGVLGALIGAAGEGLIKKSEKKTKHAVGGDDDTNITQTNVTFALYGAIGGAVGVLIGAAVGINNKIQIQGRSDADIQKDLEKLSKKARVPNFQ